MDMKKETKNGRIIYKKKKNFKRLITVLLVILVFSIMIYTEFRILGLYTG